MNDLDIKRFLYSPLTWTFLYKILKHLLLNKPHTRQNERSEWYLGTIMLLRLQRAKVPYDICNMYISSLSSKATDVFFLFPENCTKPCIYWNIIKFKDTYFHYISQLWDSKYNTVYIWKYTFWMLCSADCFKIHDT